MDAGYLRSRGYAASMVSGGARDTGPAGAPAAPTLRAPRPVRYRVAGGTTIGLEPSRAANEDAYAYLTGYLAADGVGPSAWAMLCVADGMGGMAAGEIASETAVEAVSEAAISELGGGAGVRPTAEEQADLVERWALAAHARVRVSLDALKARGGCALVCACLVDRRLAIAHVGDCRLYLVRNDAIEALTRDHSVAMERYLRAEISLAELRCDPDRSVLTRSVGAARPPEIDTLAVSTGETTRDLKPLDLVILCSDGIWEPVSEDEMLAVIRRAECDLQRAVDLILALALRRGAPDNATVVMLRLEEGAEN